mgnify:CR=1 FL=1
MVLDDCFWNRISTFQALVNLVINEIAYSNNSFPITEIVCMEKADKSLMNVDLKFVSTRGQHFSVKVLWQFFPSSYLTGQWLFNS